MDFLATPRRRRILFAALYLSEGAPIGFVWWCLPALLKSAGVPVAEITTLTALLVLPWSFKFLWAPAVDVLCSDRWALRHWIVAAQLLMALTLSPLLVLDLPGDMQWIAPLLFAHACAAATQDVAIDALAVRTASREERGRLNGWMQAGMLLGRALLGGGALLLVDLVGLAAVVLLMLAVLASSLVLLLGSREPAHTRPQRSIHEQAGAFLSALQRVATRRVTWLGLLFAATAGAAFEGAGAVAQPFLLDCGITRQEVGRLYLLPVPALLICGALLGGRLADRLGRKPVIIGAQLLIVGCVALLAGFDAAENARLGLLLSTDERTVPVSLLLGMYFGIGLFTVASYALLMDLTDPRLGGTQFSAFMGATNACEAWAGFAAGRLAAAKSLPLLGISLGPWRGYPPAFLVLAGVSLVALGVLPWLRSENISDYDEPDASS